MKLIYQTTNEPVTIGDHVLVHGGGWYYVHSFTPGNLVFGGRVHLVTLEEEVKNPHAKTHTFYPRVIGAVWVTEEMVTSRVAQRLTWDQFTKVCEEEMGTKDEAVREAVEGCDHLAEFLETGSVTIKIKGVKYVLAITVDREAS